MSLNSMREKAHRMIRLELRRILNSKDDYNPVSFASSAQCRLFTGTTSAKMGRLSPALGLALASPIRAARSSTG
jgi:hypothetical protein